MLQRVSGRVGAPMASFAMAYVMRKAPYVSPIVGGRRVRRKEG